MNDSFEPPTDHYDASIEDLDKQICQLINERKKRSNHNPGFPPQHLISSWAKTYHFYEEFLQGLFSTLYTEELDRPALEPRGFIKNISILKAHEEKDVFYSITTMRQFKNASVINLTKDTYVPAHLLQYYEEKGFVHLELSIEGNEITYECKWNGGGGSADHMTDTYVISPPLPDKETGLKFVFKEFKTPLKKEPTGVEFIIEY